MFADGAQRRRETEDEDAEEGAGPAIEETVLRALRDQLPPARRAR